MTSRGNNDDNNKKLTRGRPTGMYQNRSNSIDPIIPSLVVTSPTTPITSNPNSNQPSSTILSEQRRRPSSISYLQEDSPDPSTDEGHSYTASSPTTTTNSSSHQLLIHRPSLAEDSMNRLLAMESDDFSGSPLSVRSSLPLPSLGRSTPSPTPSSSASSTRSQLPSPPSPNSSGSILNRNQRINSPHPLPSPPIPPPSYRSPTPSSTPTSYFPLENLKKYAESDSNANSTTNLNLYHNQGNRDLPHRPQSNLSSPNRSPIVGNGGSTAIYPDWKTFTATTSNVNSPTQEKDEDYSRFPDSNNNNPKEHYSRSSRRKVPLYKKRWFWITAIILLLIGGGGGAAAGILLTKKTVAVVVPDGSLSGASDIPKQVTPLPASSTSGVIVSAAAPTASSTARRLVVFGASYCDDGHARPSEYLYTLRPAPYYKGRASNGIVWDEYLAQSLLGSSTELRNYAYSGAMVDNSITFASIPDTKAQIASYIADIKSGLVPALPAGGKTLIIVWVGLNPIMTTYTYINPSNPPTTKQIDNANSVLSNTANAVIAQITTLQVALANLIPLGSQQGFDILLLPTPPTEILPWARYTAAFGNSGGLNLIKSMTEVYNNGLMSGLSKLNSGGNYTRGRGSVVSYDIAALYQGWMADPSSADVNNVLGACVEGSVICPTPATHFWWDSIHMTTLIHQKVAQALAPGILSLWKK